MLSRKAKLLGGTLLLLGAPSGASLSTLELGNFSLGNLFNSSGGALTSQLNAAEQKKLEVGDTVKDLGLSEQQEIIVPDLKEVKELVDLSNQEKLNDNNSSTTIKTIYTETDKEEKTLSLETEGKSKVDQSRNKAKRYISEYKKGKDKMDAYLQHQKQSRLRRQRRAVVNNVSIPQLTKSERSAILEMLKIFESLEGEQQKLVPKLQKIDGVKVIVATAKRYPKISEVEKKLREIDWTTKDDLKYTLERPRSYGQRGRHAHEARWNNWNNNPYSLFLDSKGVYDGVVQNVKQAEKARDNYLASNRFGGIWSIFGGAPGVKAAYSGKAGFDQKISEAKSEISLKVAAKLLTWMNQINQS